MCSLHPISWTEKRDLGYYLVFPRCGMYSAVNPDGILMVVLTWPLIPKEEISSTSFISLLDVVISQGKGDK